MSIAAATIKSPAMRDRTAAAHRQGVARAIAVMREQIAEPITVEDLAETACMSRFHFTRAFAAVTSVPPVQFLSALRLQKAKRLLAQTQSSVTDIGFDVGYQSSGTFNGRFHSQVGVTPTAFRRGFARLGALGLEALRPLLPPAAGPGRRVVIPEGFEGLAVAAAFESRFPAGRPFSCKISPLPARSVACTPPEGSFCVLLAAMPWTSTLGAALIEESPLVARCGTGEGEDPAGLDPIVFREQTIFDPPVLTAVPLLLADYLAERPSPLPKGGEWNGARAEVARAS